jgi:RNA polymerase sigma factor (sigma-70 family)
VDGFSQYIKDILRYPLLSKQQEILLARQVREWVSTENPTPKQAKVGQRAYHKLINCNLRLVVSIAKRYTPHARRTEMFDIVQEGNMGLAHGIKKFDPERGYALSTYVYWWIRQSITRYLSCNDRMIRLPSHAVEMMSKLRAWKPKFYAAHGRYPTLEESAEHCKTNPDRLRDYLERSEDAMSLDRVINGTDGDVTLMDGITDGEHPMDKLDMLLSADEVFDMLEMLDETDRKIVIKAFGLDGKEPETYMKISRELGICRERIRQRCQRALNKMRVIANQNPLMSR